MTAKKELANPGIRTGNLRSIFCVIIFSISCSLYSQTNPSGNSLIFSEGSSILELKKSSNRENLLRIERTVERYLPQIRSGEMHISVVSCIHQRLSGNLSSINQASLIGSVIRAHFKIKYKLDNFNFTFYIDNSSNLENRVMVEVKKGSPSLHNNDIFYTTSNIGAAINAAMGKYDKIPFLPGDYQSVESGVKESKTVKKEIDNEYKYQKMAPVPSLRFYSSKILKRSAIKMKVPTITYKPLANNSIVLEKSYQPVMSSPRPDVIKKEKKYYQPYFSLKSNLVYWYGLTPNLTKSSFIPNLEGEVFYLGRYSTSIEGFYTPFETVPESAQDWFKESGLIAEQKIWIGKPKRYNTLYFGLVGTYGDYDRRDVSVSELGYTGEYYGAGLSIGFLIPVYKGVCIEIGLRGIYKLDNWESYKLRNGAFYKEESGTDSGIDLSGVKFSIQYRIGRSKSY
jgi:hypothetical protein